MNANEKYTNPKDIIGSDKAPLGLFPAAAIAEGSLAMLDGALKYGRDNFRVAGVRSSIYVDAAMRHLLAWNNGEDEAPDSGVNHLGHVLACIAILVDAQAQGSLNDDRKPFQNVAAIFAAAQDKAKAMKERHADKNPKHYTLADVPPPPPKPPVFTGILDDYARCRNCGDDRVTCINGEDRLWYCYNCGKAWFEP